MGNVFRKLDISTRSELEGALSDTTEPTPGGCSLTVSRDSGGRSCSPRPIECARPIACASSIQP